MGAWPSCLTIKEMQFIGNTDDTNERKSSLTGWKPTKSGQKENLIKNPRRQGKRKAIARRVGR